MKKLAVITGASRGIGACLTQILAKNGIHVIAIARQEALLKKIQADNPDKITIIAADLTQEEERAHVFEQLSSQPSIDYMVHNAGLITPIAPLITLSEKEIRQIIETNLMVPMLLTKALVPQMKKKSRILNVSSPFPVIMLPQAWVLIVFLKRD